MIPTYIVYALITMVSWGVWAIMAGQALEYAKAGPVVMLTYLTGLFVIFLARHESATAIDSKWGVFLAVGAGIAMAIGTLTFYRSLSIGGGSVATAIAGLYFLVTTVYEMAVVGAPPEPTKIGGLVLASAAIVLLAQ